MLGRLALPELFSRVPKVKKRSRNRRSDLRNRNPGSEYMAASRAIDRSPCSFRTDPSHDVAVRTGD
jgi:hypothetical protein